MLPDRKMKAVFSSEMLVFIYQAARCQPKDHSLYVNLLANCNLHMMRDISGSDIIFFFEGGGQFVHCLTFNEALRSGSRLCFRFEVNESA
jgi:hypothetical protein